MPTFFDRVAALFSRSPADEALRVPLVDDGSADTVVARSVDAGALGAQLAGSVHRNESLPRKGGAEVLALYDTNPWMRAIAHTIGAGVAAVPWKLYARRAPGFTKADPHYVNDSAGIARMGPKQRHEALSRAVAANEIEEITVHPLLHLLDRPNPTLSGFAQRMCTQVHLDLVGESFWILDENVYGMPTQAWAVPPTWIQRMPTTDNQTYLISSNGETLTVPVRNMLHFRDVSPGDPYGRGTGTGIALGDELDVDEQAAKMVASYFANGAVPQMIVTLEGASQSVVDRARIKWNRALQGFRKQYQTYFTGAKASVQRLDTSFKDMALVDLRKSQRDTAIQTFGLPHEKLGITDNSNKATSFAADLTFSRDVKLPRLELLRLELQTKLVPRYDPRLILEYDDPVPQDREEKRSTVVALPGRWSVNEERELGGAEALEGDDGKGFLVPPGLVYVERLSDLRSKGSPVFGYHLAAGVLTNNEARGLIGLQPTDEPWGGERTVGTFAPPLVEADPTDEPAVPEESPPVSKANPPVSRRPVLPPAQRGFVSVGQTRRILNAIKVDVLVKHLAPVTSAAFDAWAIDTANAVGLHGLGESPIGDAIDDAFARFVDDYPERMAQVNATTRAGVKAAIEAWDGEDDDALRRAVGEVFETARAVRSQLIAQVEAKHAAEAGAAVVMRESEIVEEKEWITTLDGRQRESHNDMDGQVKLADEAFVVVSGKNKGATAMFPGSFGIAGEDINCRCLSAPRIRLDDSKAIDPDGIVVVVGMTPDQRAAVWHTRDARLRREEARVMDAACAGFDDQEAAVLEVLEDVLG